MAEPRHPARALTLIAVGGGIGAVARHLLTQTLMGADHPLPWPTLVVNVVGCLLMGLLTGELTRHPLHRMPVKALLGTGFLGGFTTFSHLVDGVRELTVDGAAGWAAVYLVLSVVLGLLAVWAGLTLGGRR
ncbi:fluoride efflux transporter CrcB [Nonomuraea spiralis]|uniref:fluoride efflux transporter CrcB n=1 Tax=Nonomuraea TaxID=83681 RepID=UPI000F7AA969|nr:fluoride efflux transporter CrcB [Nonomuraea sp. WAC 01424]RSN05069.1 fluoride efflux transporter CrcB [Nonomuraea sp. WAC 01424]